MNFLQQAIRLHREIGLSGTGPTSIATASTADKRLFDWISDAWTNLQSEPMNWRWMHRSLDVPLNLTNTSYSGISMTGGAADFGRWRRTIDDYTVTAYLPSNRAGIWALEWLPLDNFNRRFDDVPLTASRPKFWAIGPDESLLIAPVADAIYNLRAEYFIKPTVLSADADVPSMPERFHMLLVWRAMIEGAQFDAAPEVLSRAMENYRALYAALKVDQIQEINWHTHALLAQ